VPPKNPTSPPPPPATPRSISGLQLAKRLGLSHATVSFVLNGIGEERKISKATITRVLSAAKRYNYAPNRFARSLKSQRSGMISVILPNFKMDWAEYVMQGMRKVFDQSDLIPFVTTHSFDEARNKGELLSFLERRDDGLITLPTMGCADLYREIAKRPLPVVFLGDEIPELTPLISSVMWEPQESIRTAIAHLANMGRQRIAFLGMDYPGLGTLHRFKAFREALHRQGLPARRHLISRPPATGTAAEIVNASLDQFFGNKADCPDAIFALNDGLALPALEELERRGLRVPDDVALVGMGNLPLTQHSAVGISTIPEPVERMAEMAAELLLDLIKGRVKPPVHKSIPTSDFIPRRSTGTPS
jgi:DNA-binding LacI/PurR family transcriptional regulator